MKKIIRLSESDLTQLIKRVIKESMWDYNQKGPLSKFSEYDLENIRDTYKRYTSDDYYGDPDTASDFLCNVSNQNIITLKSLLNWLEENNVDISDEYKQYIVYSCKKKSSF